MSTEQSLQKYIAQVQEIQNSNVGREHAYRTAFENFVQEMINSIKKDVKIIQEGKIKDFIGENSSKTPDFVVYTEFFTVKSLVGLIEVKKPEVADLEAVKKSQQIQDYLGFVSNILITNYKAFELICVENNKIKVVKTVDLFSESKDKVTQIEDLFSVFFNQEHTKLSRDKLAEILAKLTNDFVKKIVSYENNAQDKENDAFLTKLSGLKKEYNETIGIQQSFEDFTSVFAQSFIYGIVVAKIGYEQNESNIFLLNPQSVSYLDDILLQFKKDYEVLYEFLDIGLDSRKIPEELKDIFLSIAKTFNLINFSKLLQNEKSDFNQLIVYLYEDYLKAYDKQTRTQNGVYYTPKEVVDFIIKISNEALEDKLDLNNGFSNENVKVLDFATGTGSFLLSLYEAELKKIGNSNALKDRFKANVLNNYYGFELMFAPYIVAHTNLKYNLKINGIDTENQGLPIYLTNTLDLSQHSISSLLPKLKQNYEKSTDIKTNKEVIAIVGNPPYNSKSTNMGAAILDKLQAYKEKLNEKNPKPLNDDYVKFICFAENKIVDAGYGIIGIITNNSFLNGVTHRVMRKHLLDTFDDIYIVNLHGNSNIKEGDKNVFDIRVGTNITLFIKNKKQSKNLANVYYYSTLNNNLISRKEKFNFLNNNNLQTINWQKLDLLSPNYFFNDIDLSSAKEYQEHFLPLVTTEEIAGSGKKSGKSQMSKLAIFNLYSTCVKTGRDDFTIHYTKQSLENLKADIQNLEIEEIRTKYQLPKDSTDWKIENAKADLINNYNPQKINYRPFDFRYTSLSTYNGGFLAGSRYNVMQHFDNKENIGLIFSRLIKSDKFFYMSISDCIAEYINLSAKTSETAYLSPLYVYPIHKEDEVNLETQKRPNFTNNFTKALQTLSFSPSPEDILHYIYAIVHHETYRTKYLEFLKIDFPKIPFTTLKDEFYAFAHLGEKLTNVHTLKNIPSDASIDYQCYKAKEKCDLSKVLDDKFVINKISYNDNTIILEDTLKHTIEIMGITQDIYDYQIGSYKVLDKWLKSRKSDNVVLTSSDIQHIINVANVISSSIKIQNTISDIPLPKTENLLKISSS